MLLIVHAIYIGTYFKFKKKINIKKLVIPVFQKLNQLIAYFCEYMVFIFLFNVLKKL